MNLHEERLSGKHIFKGRVIDLEVDQIRLPDGHDSIREVINHPGGVAIAALNERDELLMVRQFRYPFHSVLLELPAGKLEPGEVPLEAAKREQKEETGTQAEEYISLGKCYATPAYCTEQIHLWGVFGSGDHSPGTGRGNGAQQQDLRREDPSWDFKDICSGERWQTVSSFRKRSCRL